MAKAMCEFLSFQLPVEEAADRSYVEGRYNRAYVLDAIHALNRPLNTEKMLEMVFMYLDSIADTERGRDLLEQFRFFAESYKKNETKTNPFTVMLSNREIKSMQCLYYHHLEANDPALLQRIINYTLRGAYDDTCECWWVLKKLIVGPYVREALIACLNNGMYDVGIGEIILSYLYGDYNRNKTQ